MQELFDSEALTLMEQHFICNNYINWINTEHTIKCIVKIGKKNESRQ